MQVTKRLCIILVTFIMFWSPMQVATLYSKVWLSGTQEGENEDQHFLHLKQVFQRFEEYKVVLNASKSVLGETSVKFLGYIVTAEGISPIPGKVAAITNFPKPENVKDLRRFLATCNFYRRFIPQVARTQTVLNNYLKEVKRNDLKLILWSDDSTAAFEKGKKDMAEASLEQS
ncbi:retrovirus-related Pol polyprotein from transposon 17.6 [Nephila pilipes]|uniref:Retrovirus-related Pol polyprotein from transposon 17.6 n=1 Tax=Nephila pilipes TaxID=299642 RepID=A0A8X6P1R9_NEPPI|nr:retrovirus-related Pol polyprotein from transposon 17.6 [Nephila pilipes]